MNLLKAAAIYPCAGGDGREELDTRAVLAADLMHNPVQPTPITRHATRRVQRMRRNQGK